MPVGPGEEVAVTDGPLQLRVIVGCCDTDREDDRDRGCSDIVTLSVKLCDAERCCCVKDSVRDSVLEAVFDDDDESLRVAVGVCEGLAELGGVTLSVDVSVSRVGEDDIVTVKLSESVSVSVREIVLPCVRE